MERWLERFARAGFLRSSDTAHDLKTPLNIAVLNLELLRMRVRKLTGEADDEKLEEYARSLETELRRMARIFDAFFVLSTPPKGDDAPLSLDASALCLEAAEEAGYEAMADGPANVAAHEMRIRQAFDLFFTGASKVLAPEGRRLAVLRDGNRFHAVVSGQLQAADIELSKLFKFYYTDPSGNPDVSLAASRLIAETYGGELNAIQESDKVSLRLTLPLEEP